MAHAPSLTRTERATGICERQDLHLRDDGTWQVRDIAGSGRWHTVFEGHCTCPDYTFRHMTCKHLRAVAAEERALAAYCDEWNTRAAEARIAADDLPGDFLDAEMHFADTSLLLSPEDHEWLQDDVNRDVPTSGYGSDGWPEQRCPTCSAPLDTRSYYVGGKGYCYFSVCSRDTAHHSQRA